MLSKKLLLMASLLCGMSMMNTQMFADDAATTTADIDPETAAFTQAIDTLADASDNQADLAAAVANLDPADLKQISDDLPGMIAEAQAEAKSATGTDQTDDNSVVTTFQAIQAAINTKLGK